MAITYTWKVTSIKTKNEGENKDAVVQTYWTKTGKDENGNEGVFSGATPFKDGNPSDPNFVPFNQLTEETQSTRFHNSRLTKNTNHSQILTFTFIK